VATCPEVCNDGIDNDGDAAIDCADTDCAVPTITIANNRPTTFCQGDSTILTATAVAGATYAWSSGQTTDTIHAKTGGNFTVTVSKNGCTNTANKAVAVNTAPAAPSVASANMTACAGGTTTLTASGGAGATFTWRKPDGSTTSTNPLSIAGITAGQAGTYSVKQTVSGCPSIDSAVVAVTVQSCGVTVACTDIPNVKIGIDTNVVEAGTTFSWVIPSGITRLNTVATPDTMIRLNFAGQPLGVAYPVKLVTTKGSCTDTALFMVTLPSSCSEVCNNGVDDDADGKIDCLDEDCAPQNIKIALDSLHTSPFICTGDSLILKVTTVAGVTYAWSNGKTTDTIKVRSSGTYTVSVTINGCTKTASQKVTVSNCETQLTCAELTNSLFRVPLPNTNDETYRWLLPAGASRITSSALDTTINVAWDTLVALPNRDHALKLEITNKASGCKDTTLLNVFVPTCGEICSDGIDNDNDGMTDCQDPECNILPRTIVFGGISNGNSFCKGDSMVLSVANVPLSTTYRWAMPTGDTVLTPSVFAKNAGTYYVTVTANGCSKTASVKTLRNSLDVQSNRSDFTFDLYGNL
jgi:hypothetical protein